MTRLIKEKGAKGRLHIDTPMMGESLVSKEFQKRTESKEYFRMQPEINVLKIGGQSIIDRGGDDRYSAGLGQTLIGRHGIRV